MLARWAGLPAASVAFLGVAHVVGNFADSGVPLLAGGTAAFAVWSYFHRLDCRRLDALLNPPPALWPVPLPVAWGILRDAFDSAFITTIDGALVPWILQRQDQSRGLLTASLNCDELLGSGTDAHRQPRTIVATAILSPADKQTQVEMHYRLFSPVDTHLAEQVIGRTIQQLASNLDAYNSLA
jgi:hypothetical protein